MRITCLYSAVLWALGPTPTILGKGRPEVPDRATGARRNRRAYRAIRHVTHDKARSRYAGELVVPFLIPASKGHRLHRTVGLIGLVGAAPRSFPRPAEKERQS